MTGYDSVDALVEVLRAEGAWHRLDKAIDEQLDTLRDIRAERETLEVWFVQGEGDDAAERETRIAAIDAQEESIVRLLPYLRAKAREARFDYLAANDRGRTIGGA